MAYTALQLITRAYYLSQIVSRQLQVPDGQQISDGLYLLNALLDYKSTDLRLIPYFTQTHLTLTANTEKYNVPNLLFIDSMTFNIGVVRYPMMDLSRKEFFSTARVDDIANLPWSYRPERVLGGMDIYIYFLSGQDYESTIWGKYALSDVTLSTDMSLTYDTFYIEYLRYSLAEYICSEWGATFPDESKAQLARMEKKLLDVSPPDLTIMKSSYFNTRCAIDWQVVNLSKGWFPY
jgi:hypothetical protein